MSENFDLDTGKNIVDALKADTEDDVLEVKEDTVELDTTETQDNVMPTFADEEEPSTEKFDSSMKPSSDFENNMDDDFQHAVVENYANDLYNFEVPNNVAVLKKLIAKLPSGVTRQTGAQIIKQTMEALGISLEEQAQSYKKQYNNLNELVSLFINTDN